MENDQHDVFFEGNNLSDVDVKQIRTYFSLKRKSGGGQCEISKVGDNTYKISFMNKKGKEVNVLLLQSCFLHIVTVSAVLYFT